MRLTLLVSPATGTHHRFDSFAAELSASAVTPVSLVKGTLADAPADGFIVLHGMAHALVHSHPHLCPRVVALDAHQAGILLRRYRLAAAITDRGYLSWAQDQDYGPGFIGRTDVFSAMGWTMREFPNMEGYAEPRGTTCTLPALLAAYLLALTRLDPGVLDPP